MKSSDNQIFETKAVEYDTWFEKHPVLFENELKLIRKVIPPNGLGIEIGMGTGRFSKALNIKIGVEPSWPMAQLAISRGIIALDAKAEALPLFNQSFDYALMVTVDCFLENIQKALSEIHRILKIDGLLLIAMIDRNSELGKLYEAQKTTNEWYKNANFHTVMEITDLMAQAGFGAFEYWQTLIGDIEKDQQPIPGYGTGSFIIIRSQKR